MVIPTSGVVSESEKMFVEKLAEYVKSRRLALGISQREVARRGGIDFNYVSRLENMARLGSFENLIGLARGLDVRPGVLLDVLAGYEAGDADALRLMDSNLRKVILTDVMEYLREASKLAELEELFLPMGKSKPGSEQPATGDSGGESLEEVFDRLARKLGSGHNKIDHSKPGYVPAKPTPGQSPPPPDGDGPAAQKPPKQKQGKHHSSGADD